MSGERPRSVMIRQVRIAGLRGTPPTAETVRTALARALTAEGTDAAGGAQRALSAGAAPIEAAVLLAARAIRARLR